MATKALALFAMLCMFALACSSSVHEVQPGTLLDHKEVVVREFATFSAKVEKFPESKKERLGMHVAEQIAIELRKRKINARAISANAPVPAGSLVIEGDLATVQGGSKFKRFFWWGWGSAVADLRARVEQADGSLLATLAARPEKHIGICCWELAIPNEAFGESTLQVACRQVADMLATGYYRAAPGKSQQ